MKPLKFFFTLSSVIITVLGLSISLQSILAAWQAPSGEPPNGNATMPLNISMNGQIKEGGMIIAASSTIGIVNGLLVLNGNVGLGLTNPQQKLDVAGNIRADNYSVEDNFNLSSQIASDSSVQGSMQFYTTHSASANAYTYQRFSPAFSYAVESGDVLEYDVYCSAENPNGICDAGIDIRFSDANYLRFYSNTDQNGISNQGGNISSYALGRWYHRKVDLAEVVGKTVSFFDVLEEGNSAGTYVNYYRRIIITNGNNLKLTAWDTGNPGANTNDLCGSCSSPAVVGSYYNNIYASGSGSNYFGGNVGIGTAPSYRLDVRDTSNTQLVANFGSSNQTVLTGLTLSANTGNAQIWKNGSGYSGYGGARSLNIYNSENYPIAFYQGGNERMRINSGGNVGIGTNNPTYKLSISDSSQTWLQTNLGSATQNNGSAYSMTTNSGTGYVFYTGSVQGSYGGPGSLVLYNSANAPMTFYLGGTERMRIKGDGNVGIGTNNPGYKLDVSGTANIAGFRMSTGASAGYVLTSDASGNASWQFSVGGGGGGGVATGSPGQVAWYPNNAPYVAGTNNLYIKTSDGNVGVGTTNPTARLAVIGNGTGNVMMGDPGYANYGAISLNGTLTGNNYNFTSSPSDRNLYINRPSGSSIRFRENNSDQVIIDTGGNVGINTVSPGALFHVNGSMYLSPAFYDGVYGTTIKIGWTGDPDVYSSIASTISQGGAVQNGLRFNIHGGTASLNQVNVLTLLGTGNAGIGTTSPNAKLEIYDNTANPNSLAKLRVTNTAGNPEMQLQYGAAANAHWGIYNEQSNDSFRIWGNGADNLVIKQDGNVGIGRADPANKLDVNGIIEALGIKIPTGAGAGKVLTSDASGLGSWQDAAAAAGGGGGFKITDGGTIEGGGTGVEKKIMANWTIIFFNASELYGPYYAGGYIYINSTDNKKYATWAQTGANGMVYSYELTGTFQCGWTNKLFCARIDTDGKLVIQAPYYTSRISYVALESGSQCKVTARLSDNWHNSGHNCDDVPGTCCPSGYHMCRALELRQADMDDCIEGYEENIKTPDGWVNMTSDDGFTGYTCSGWTGASGYGLSVSRGLFRYSSGWMPIMYMSINFFETSCGDSRQVWCCK